MDISGRKDGGKEGRKEGREGGREGGRKGGKVLKTKGNNISVYALEALFSL